MIAVPILASSLSGCRYSAVRSALYARVSTVAHTSVGVTLDGIGLAPYG